MNAYGFMPHGYCFEWRHGVLWLYVLSDLSIGIAYYCIPFVIFYFLRKRRDLPLQHVFRLFGAFILLCGTTHLLGIWVLWHANYYIEGYVKALTAVVSVATLFAIIIVLPRALGLRGTAELSAANAELTERYVKSAERGRVKLSAVVDNVIDGIITIGELGNIMTFNAACSGMFGYTPAEVLGRDGMSSGKVDIAQELSHVRENPWQLIADTGAVITSSELPEVQGNAVQLMRLLQNLIANAIKFQPLGQVPVIHIGASRQADHGLFSVRDNGLGIDPAFIERIFEPYRRLHKWDLIRGTGLGLAISRKIVENHGGRIWAASADAGSTIFFKLPG